MNISCTARHFERTSLPSSSIHFRKYVRTPYHIKSLNKCWYLKKRLKNALIRQNKFCVNLSYKTHLRHVIYVFSGRRINCYVRVPFFVADEKDLSYCITGMFSSGNCNRPCNMCVLKFKAGAGEAEPSITEKGNRRMLSEMKQVLECLILSF